MSRLFFGSGAGRTGRGFQAPWASSGEHPKTFLKLAIR
jgi:hypothetical protein